MSPTSIQFSLDLKSAALLQLDFLERVKNCKSLKNPDVLRLAIYRYENIWLPLLSKSSTDVETDLDFVPPLDIHWIWHVHMLSPIDYHNDCETRFGRTFNHQLKPTHQLEEKTEFTKEKWIMFFPDDDFTFPKSEDEILNLSQKTEKTRSNFSYDLFAAALRQQNFYYQVSLPHYKTKDFLEESEQRYKKFINLKDQNRNAFLVPSYDIDLIWHTHQVHPLAYKKDMNEILGILLPHDDTDTDRTPNSKLTNSYDETAKLWKLYYNEPYAKNGSLFRGGAPQERLSEISDDFMEKLNLSPCKEFRLENIQIFNVPSRKSKKVHNVKLIIIHNVSVNGRDISSEIIHTQDLKIGPMPGDLNLNFKKSEPVLLTNFGKSYLQVKLTKLYSKKGRYNNVTEKHGIRIGFNDESQTDLSYQISMVERFEMLYTPTRGTLSLTYNGITKKVAPLSTSKWWHLFTNNVSSTLLTIVPQKFVDSSDGGDIMLYSDDKDQELGIKTATHKFLLQDDSEYVSVKLAHSLPLKMSVISIFAVNKLVMMAHLVDSRTIGKLGNYKLSLVEGSSPIRAMVIKDSDGDVGIGFAQWVGMKKRIPPTKGQKGEEGKPGYFQFFYFDLKTNEERFNWEPKDQNLILKLQDGVVINFSTGTIAIPNSQSRNGVFTVCLAFVVSTLYLLVQPRPVKIKQILPQKANPVPAYFRNSSNILINCSGWEICDDIPNTIFVSSDPCFVVKGNESNWKYVGYGSACGGCGAGCGTEIVANNIGLVEEGVGSWFGPIEDGGDSGYGG